MCFYLVEFTAENNYWAQASQFIQRTSSHSLPAQNRQEWVSFCQIKYHTALCLPRRGANTAQHIRLRWGGCSCWLLFRVQCFYFFALSLALWERRAPSTLGPRRVSLVYIRFLLVDSQNPASARSRPSRKGAKKCGCSLKRAREREMLVASSSKPVPPSGKRIYSSS